MKMRRITAVVVVLLSVALMAHAGLRLWKAEQIYREGDTAYEAIVGLAKKSRRLKSRRRISLL